VSYLEPHSFQALSASGLEPLATFSLVPFQTVWSIGIPADPALAGVIVTTQALILGPSGIPTPVGNGQATNALQLTLGY
jgi:hypothetical protein